ncbi:MAG: hypothetical protein ACFWTZ_08325 [Burkholderia sp.]|jgi:CRP-like cAMP-binding protein
MKTYSSSWFEALQHPSCLGKIGPDPLTSDFPVLPWLTQRVHPAIAAMIEQCGIERELPTGENLFQPGTKIASLVLIESGVTARCLGNPHAQAKQAIALATPGHFAAGNLNFFSHRHAIGRYYTLTPAKLIYCPRKLLGALLDKDTKLFKQVVVQFELSSLSDRLGFACISLLGAEDRLKVLFLVWGINFGTLIESRGATYIRMPSPLTRQVRASVISSSVYWIDHTLKKWKAAGIWKRDGEWEYCRLSFLKDIYDWLRRAGESSSDYAYPEDLKSLFI